MKFKIARFRIVVGFAVVGLIAFAGCGGDDAQTHEHTSGTNAADASHSDHSHGATTEHPRAASEHPSSGGSTTSSDATLAGVTFTPPADWQDLGEQGMRKGQYRLAPVDGDNAQGEVNIFYFGPTSGGGVDANLNRWIGQMVMPDGSDPAAAAVRGTFTADGMPGHIVSLDGTYKSGGGRPMGGTTTMLENYRLVGVVIEGPQGSLFFKLTGPLATAKAMESDLMAMVKSAHR